MNSCNFVGRLCADPELRRTNDGTAVCSFSIAVKRPMASDTTDFIDVVAWRQSAEYLVKYGHRGDVVAVSGPLQIRIWEDKSGTKRRSAEVHATSLDLIPSRKKSEEGGSQASSGRPYGGSGGNSEKAQYNQQRSDGYQQILGEDKDLPF